MVSKSVAGVSLLVRQPLFIGKRPYKIKILKKKKKYIYIYINKTGNALWRNTEARSCNHRCSGKAISIIYSEWMSVDSVTQHAMRMHQLSFVACPALQYFYTLFHKLHGFQEKKKLNMKCVNWSSLQLSSETFFIKNRARYYHKCRLVFM
jgi:hypothetical protein